MKIVSYDSARVTWLFPLEEFAPASGAHSISIVGLLAQRYQFTITPKITTKEDMAKSGLQFGMGGFEYQGQRIIVPDFVVYNDGLVAITQKTEWSEAFLEDVTQWVIKEFGFRNPTSGTRKLYSSTLVVDFETQISRLVVGYKRIAEIISSRVVTIMPEPKPMHFSRIDFEVDKRTLEGQLALPKFILERRGGVLFSQERFFSVAPMHTADHLQTLIDIEKLATET